MVQFIERLKEKTAKIIEKIKGKKEDMEDMDETEKVSDKADPERVANTMSIMQRLSTLKLNKEVEDTPITNIDTAQLSNPTMVKSIIVEDEPKETFRVKRERIIKTKLEVQKLRAIKLDFSEYTNKPLHLVMQRKIVQFPMNNRQKMGMQGTINNAVASENNTPLQNEIQRLRDMKLDFSKFARKGANASSSKKTAQKEKIEDTISSQPLSDSTRMQEMLKNICSIRLDGTKAIDSSNAPLEECRVSKELESIPPIQPPESNISNSLQEYYQLRKQVAEAAAKAMEDANQVLSSMDDKVKAII